MYNTEVPIFLQAYLKNAWIGKARLPMRQTELLDGRVGSGSA